MKEWSTLKKLIWLRRVVLGGAKWIWETVQGVLPLTLTNAVSSAIRSLIRYGKCEQNGTPIPSAPVDIVCNNGAIKWDSVNQRVYTDGTDEVLTVSASGANPQTASVVDLFAVGNHEDEHDIISGLVTHNVGVLVLDGAETNLSYSSSLMMIALDGKLVEKSTMLCSHFQYSEQTSSNCPDGGFGCGADSINVWLNDSTLTSLTDWRAWLASQHANGTPVIIIYPLAGQDTESVTAQPLSTADGDNAVSATANVSDVTIEVVYAKAV